MTLRRLVVLIGCLFCLFVPVAQAADVNVTPSTFSSAVSSAQAGDTLHLASGSYGAFNGTNKAITIVAQSGATPTMTVNFGSGDSGFTLDGMTGMQGAISAGASNITIKNSSFVGQLDVEGAMTNIVLDGDHFDWPAVSNGGWNAKLFLSTSGSSPGAAVTVKNSTFLNGDLDGIHFGGGSGDLVLNNEFGNLCDRNVNHTDNIQFEGGSQVRIAGNYVHEAQNCPTQGITSYDGGTNGVIIEDNVVDVPRDWGIELYKDNGSIVRHNTVVYHPTTYTEFHTVGGQIDIDHKSGQACGSGTHVYDNIGTADMVCPGTADHNNNGSTATFVGPSNTYAGWKLAPNSPVGLGAASDGLDLGVRFAGSPPPPPPPPTVNITGHPDSSTQSTTAQFTFTLSDGSATCQLDSGQSSSCTSPQSYSGLSVGQHTFTVTGTNSGGSTGAAFAWTITSPPPPADADGDGVPDSSDACPALVGQRSDGCPDAQHTIQAYADLAAANQQLSTLQGQLADVQSQLTDAGHQIDTLQARIDTLTSELADRDSTISGLQDQLAQAQADRDAAISAKLEEQAALDAANQKLAQIHDLSAP